MGNESSLPDARLADTARSRHEGGEELPQLSPYGPPSGTQAEQISYCIQYAKRNYETNPTDSLRALLEALTLNGGKAAADQAMDRLNVALGPEITRHVVDRQTRWEQAVHMVEQLLQDESTLLYQQGKQHILQQALEDGSSVVCSLCNGMVPVTRWQQHQEYWCEAVENTHR
jgi:hypothetical protein